MSFSLVQTKLSIISRCPYKRAYATGRQMGEDGKISWCDVRDSMLRKLFDAISGLLLPSS